MIGLTRLLSSGSSSIADHGVDNPREWKRIILGWGKNSNFDIQASSKAALGQDFQPEICHLPHTSSITDDSPDGYLVVQALWLCYSSAADPSAQSDYCRIW